MTGMTRILLAGAVVAATTGFAQADQLLGTYIARISDNDHFASDGYRLDTAAQMVRQDRANWHKFGRGDREDQDDPWFASTASRAKFERMLSKGGAINQATRRAIAGGDPVIEVEVYRNSVRVRVIGY